MATVAEIQAELGTNGMAANIIRSEPYDATYDAHYVVGLTSAPGRSRWCVTTNADSAADQASDILDKLKE